MTTPEGKIKALVKKLLDEYKSVADQYWPVPAGIGPSHLDCIVCFCGEFIAIETKAPGKKPTPRQNHRIQAVKRAGGQAFVVDGEESLDILRGYLSFVYNNHLRKVLREHATRPSE